LLQEIKNNPVLITAERHFRKDKGPAILDEMRRQAIGLNEKKLLYRG
jgi:hypothetical protein